MKYKALLCDVDGTLIPNHPNNGVAPRVREAIARASEKIYVGLATARSYTAAYPLLEELKLTAPCILMSGGQIVDPKTKKIVVERTLKIPTLKKVIDLLTSISIKMQVTDYGRELQVTDKYIPYKPLGIYTDQLPLNRASFVQKELEKIPQIAIDKAPSWEKGYAHVIVTNPQATKQYGALEVAKRLNIQTHEMIGIGEGYNDFSLLMACGFKIAMGNAVKEVKEIADYVAPSVDEDGVAEVIEKYIL